MAGVAEGGGELRAVASFMILTVLRRLCALTILRMVKLMMSVVRRLVLILMSVVFVRCSLVPNAWLRNLRIVFAFVCMYWNFRARVLLFGLSRLGRSIDDGVRYTMLRRRVMTIGWNF